MWFCNDLHLKIDELEVLSQTDPELFAKVVEIGANTFWFSQPAFDGDVG